MCAGPPRVFFSAATALTNRAAGAGPTLWGMSGNALCWPGALSTASVTAHPGPLVVSPGVAPGRAGYHEHMWVSAAGAVMGEVFGTVARLRHGKPLHPHGVVYDAVLHRAGSPQPWGAEWLDAAGEDHGLVRASRAAGMPRPLPDVLGLALTFSGPSGDRHDLLLATTGLRPGARFVLLPRREPFAVAYGSLLPYRAPRGLVLLAAVPMAPAGAVAKFRLLAATPTGRWRAFARLDLTGRTGPAPDQPIRFDPVLHVLPGLAWPPALARLREPAYAAARRA